MIIQRVWAWPTGDTFSCAPIKQLVKRYLAQSTVSIDPFARNKQWATYTNDLNPNTTAQYHMDVRDFLQMLVDQNVQADLILFDPPYSPAQVKQLYDSIGQKTTQQDVQRTSNWPQEKALCHQLLKTGGHILCFGWDSVGMGNSRLYQLLEVLLVCHGPTHHDTICVVEQKLAHQLELEL